MSRIPFASLTLLPALALMGCDEAANADLQSQIDTLTAQNATLQATVDGLVTDLEAAQADIEALSGGEGFSGLDARVTDLEEAGATTATTLGAVQTELDATSATVGDHVEDIAANAAAISTNAAAILVNADDITENGTLAAANATSLGTLQAQADANTTDIASNTAAIASNTAAIVANADDIDANGASIATNGAAITSNASDLDDLTDTVDSLSASVDEIETDVDDNAADIAGQATDIAANTTDITALQDDVSLLETYAEVQSTTFTSSDNRETGYVNDRTLTFSKVENDTQLWIQYTDNWRQYRNGAACQWEIYIDDARCTSPGALQYNLYTATTSGTPNHHTFGSVEGYCSTTTKGAIRAGSHTIKVYVREAPGYSTRDCYTGWNGMRGNLTVREIPK